jgi:hypothetical protein
MLVNVVGFTTCLMAVSGRLRKQVTIERLGLRDSSLTQMK